MKSKRRPARSNWCMPIRWCTTTCRRWTTTICGAAARPAMTTDDRRRGRPPCHKAFDEATAILVGDALQPLAFEFLARDPALPASTSVRLQLIGLLAEASGSFGMAGGQAIDMAAQGRTLDLA